MKNSELYRMRYTPEKERRTHRPKPYTEKMVRIIIGKINDNCFDNTWKNGKVSKQEATMIE